LEKSITFNYGRAIIWQIKFTLNNVTNKKTMTQALQEIENLSELYGMEFERYVLKELIEQLDLKDSQKQVKDKNEHLKIQILNSELLRISSKPSFT